MATFDTKNFTEFKTDFTIHNGEVIDENNLNLAPLRLKKELNNIYNIQRINNGYDPLSWNNIETYLPGEIVIDDDGKWYRAKMYTFNNKPSDSPKQWEHITYTDISDYEFLNYLAKDNTVPYTPTDDYNPATKKYVDDLIFTLKGPDGYAVDSDGNYPTNYKGTGEVKQGEGFYITDISNGNKVGTKTVNVGDLLIALRDNPGNDDSKWIIIESNRDQATETIKGVARIATQDETNNGSNDNTIVTPLKLSNRLSLSIIPSKDNTYDLGSSSKRYKNIYAVNIHGTVSGTVSNADKLDNLDSTQFLRSDVDDTHSSNITPASDNTYNLGSSSKRYKNIYAVQFYGHLNGNASGVDPNSVALGTDTTGDYVKNLTAGSGISISGGTGEGSTPTISHSDTSSQTSVNNSGRTYIQSITLDSFGHITNITSATETVTDTNTFTGLTDTPSGYSSNAGKVVAVKSDESGLEFIDMSSDSSTFVGLTDTPSSYSGKAGQFAVVNSSENSMTFTNVIDGGSY